MTTLSGERIQTHDTTTFARQTCCSCGVAFYWPDCLEREARERKRKIYCPGCGEWMTYTKTETQRLNDELEQEKARTGRLIAEAHRARESAQAARRSRQAMKGHVTRVKRRLAEGKCVFCSCKFADLAEHMAAEHPGLGK